MDIQPSEKSLERAKEVISRGGGLENIAAAIEVAVMVEREECARIALKVIDSGGTSEWVAFAIRARESEAFSELLPRMWQRLHSGKTPEQGQ